ncbi:peroxisomal and mitochondrial division factor 2 [Ziziphus jujuba]|uniref:Peroxisomal and mitochondrial division factor 2 n=2 Tax=Ziziphus jujuba TaxID=326968 RepID=A0ABM3IH38_ZIZJJ|nr:peroxisomal and mitochondrial division factor 2 [Ziziphus jujuba]XP_048328230.1 peroxisomal and mitochondrial division factor 2 [Ziziphus jujuba]KAH7533741.1 hypothetical protein FEM48_Zijuj04G0163800 [Ziziphus jujuba var. spinosa]
MADENTVNGVGDQTTENFYDVDQTAELSRKIEKLEREKQELVSENEEDKERIKKMTAEIRKLKSDEAELKEKLVEKEREIEQSEDGKNVLESIAKRAVELETEVSRLQHDLITSMNESQEKTDEVVELKKVSAEKGAKIDALEKEVERLKTAKAEAEMRVRELERKVGILEVKEIEDKSRKLRVEEELKERVGEKEKEIIGFKKTIEQLESEIAKNAQELAKWAKDKLGVDDELRESQNRAKAMELKIVELQEEIEEAAKAMKDKTVEAINGTVTEVKELFNGGEEDTTGLNLPVVVGSTGAIAVAAVALYVLYGKRR